MGIAESASASSTSTVINNDFYHVSQPESVLYLAVKVAYKFASFNVTERDGALGTSLVSTTVGTITVSHPHLWSWVQFDSTVNPYASVQDVVLIKCILMDDQVLRKLDRQTDRYQKSVSQRFHSHGTRSCI